MLKGEAFNDSLQFLGLSKKNGFKASKLYTYKGENFTVSRTLPAYRVNSLGLLELMGANVPRIDYKNTCPELLCENEATNIITQSETITLSFSGVVNLNDAEAPNGDMTADSFNVTDNTNGGNYKPITLVNGSSYVYSVWLKGSVNGQKVLLQTDFNGDLTTLTLTTEWVRYSYFFTANSSTAQNIYLLNGSYITPASNEIYYIWGQQLEENYSGKATSYIPTTTVAVTRPADIVSNNTQGYDIDQATIFVRARLDFTESVQGVVTLWDGSSFDDYITIYYVESVGDKFLLFTTFTNPDENTYTLQLPDDNNQVYNIAFAYDLGGGNSYSIAVNGIIEFTGNFANATPASNLLTTMVLGDNITIKDSRTIGFMFFDSKLDDTSLENLTA